MADSVFRKKSIERVSSPEALNDYVRVANPSVWVILCAIIVLLVGICVWGVLGHLDTKVSVGAISEQGSTTCYVAEDVINRLEKGMKVNINGETGTVTAISSTPVQLTEQDAYLAHLSGTEAGQWMYEVKCDVSLADGTYAAEIVIDSVSPMSFVLN